MTYAQGLNPPQGIFCWEVTKRSWRCKECWRLNPPQGIFCWEVTYLDEHYWDYSNTVSIPHRGFFVGKYVHRSKKWTT